LIQPGLQGGGVFTRQGGQLFAGGLLLLQTPLLLRPSGAFVGQGGAVLLD